MSMSNPVMRPFLNNYLNELLKKKKVLHHMAAYHILGYTRHSTALTLYIPIYIAYSRSPIKFHSVEANLLYNSFDQ